VPLYLTEEDVDALLDPASAVDAVEGSFLRQAAGEIDNRPRDRLPLERGMLALMAASDHGLGLAGVKTYAAGPCGAVFVFVLFDANDHHLIALIEADRLGRFRTGAATGVAAKHLAREDASTVGLIGCGWQAEMQVEAVRAALPGVERVVAFCRTPERLDHFCRKVGAEPAESQREAGEQDVVITITTSRDPVLRGEWLKQGALVCAAGANRAEARELDNAVLERAAFVCCDSVDDARIESGDLIEPVEQGVLDWLEVHELAEVVSGAIPGRQRDEDIVVFKSNGIAAWDVAIAALAVARAKERGLGREL
jgi:ornithine cyclodeaminase/alanine dehydrogenase